MKKQYFKGIGLLLVAFVGSLAAMGSPAFCQTVQLPHTGRTNCYDTAGNQIACSVWDTSLATMDNLVQAIAQDQSSASYTKNDLVGTWNANALASGPGAPWWVRVTLTAGEDGTFSGNNRQYDGTTKPAAGVLVVSPDGIASLTTKKGDKVRCNMDSDKTVMACTSTWHDGSGTTDLMVFTKEADSYSLADLTGKWYVNGLAAGPSEPYWLRGSVTVNSDGTFTKDVTDSKGFTDTSNDTFFITSQGLMTQAGASDAECRMDEGKTVFVCTYRWGDGTAFLMVATKEATSYSLADLAGTWDANSLVSGPGAPWWERATIRMNSDGSFTGTLVYNDGTRDTKSGTFDMAPDGTITFGNEDVCRMDADKTVFVCTGTWSHGDALGTTEIKVFTKRAPAKIPLTVTKTKIRGGNGTVTSDLPGIDCGGVCKYHYDSGSSVTLTATATPGTNSVFTGWSGNGCSGTGQCVVTVDEAKTVKATFAGPVNLSVTKILKKGGRGTVTSDVGGIDCGTTCKVSYQIGSSVTLTATPTPGTDSVFTGWSEKTCTGTDPCSVTMDRANTVKATFAGPVALTVARSFKKGATGTVTSDVGGIECGSTCKVSYQIGSTVILTAVPGTNSVFTGWSLSTCTGTDPCSVTMDGAKTVKATFNKGS